MIRNILLIIAVLFAISYAVPVGKSIFYSTLTYTNAEYGFGAAFPCNVWFNGPLGLLRIDYYNINKTAVFLSVFYNYTSGDKYEVCNGGNCAHATWNTPAPQFYGDTSSNFATTTCQTPDYPGPYACTNYPSCKSVLTSPNQATGIWSLSFLDSAYTQLCLVRWTPASGQQYGPEWQIITYVTSSFANPSPAVASTYSNVIAGVTCPQPTCYAELDIAIIVDESGSIFQASAWNDVQNFVFNLINTLQLAPNGIRAGLAYFSGYGDCYHNWTGTGAIPCPGTDKNNQNCGECGGMWETLTTGVITCKSTLYNLAYNHQGAKGYTCISCGLDVGIQILNYAPKANVQKLIILFTDGAQNRVTNTLSNMGSLATSMGIKVIAVATGLYKLSDLQQFTNQIYTSSSYSGLSSLIQSIVSPLCQPLPNIDTCDFCSGLCSCTTTCNCPACNDYNACTTENCNTAPPPQGTSGVCVSINVTCDDNNPCTQNLCNTTTGCYYTVATVQPSNDTNTFCKRYVCTNPAGFTLTDVGSTYCPQGSNLCQINYCNTSIGNTNGLAGSCVIVDKTTFASGTSVTYTNSAGQTITVAGCGKPTSALPCQVYSCNTTTGACSINNAACLCMTSSDCNDANGCTNDVCNTTLNQCTHSNVDCWSYLSNGNCQNGITAVTLTASTGIGYYYGNLSFPTTGGLPTIASSSCDYLACFNGQRSSYTCSSTGNSTFQCQRQTQNCQSTACSDNVCRSVSAWLSGPQVVTDCGYSVTKTCNDNNLCTSDVCNSAFSGTSCQNSGTCVSMSGGARCLFPSNSTNCATSNVCQSYTCLTNSGCNYTTLATPTPNFCLSTGCNPMSGNFSNVNPAACSSNPDKCIITYCNTTSQKCISFNKTSQAISNTTYYVDQYGTLNSVTGCYQPHICIVYSCNSATGLCTVNSSACNCTQNSDCNDNNGCTNDVCTANQCYNTPYDCYSILSNGGCTVNNASFVLTNATGYTNYLAGSPNNPFVQGNYNCDQMACYSGLRSQYYCQNVSSSNYTCSRTYSNCAKGGCLDTICTSLGTWSNGQANTDCSASYTPTCISNGCTSSVCNSAYVYGSSGNRCTVTNNGTSCDDNNPCTINNCIPATGCDFSQPTPLPASSLCIYYACSPAQGIYPINNGSNACPASTSLCVFNYCNTTSNTCVQWDLGTFPLGSTVSYVDSYGVLNTLSGCGDPYTPDPLSGCRHYGCNATTGQCYVNTTSCNCLTDSDCADGNGCTIDKCNYTLNACTHTPIDCYNILSNGSCSVYPSSSTYPVDLFTGINIYYGNASVKNVYTKVDANGLPSPSTGVSRTCGQLACYGGQPSQYSCFSIQEGQYTCVRTYVNCSRNGCQDNICRALGTWNYTSGIPQPNTDCGTTYVPNCASDNACTVNLCNSAWVPGQPVSSRCIHSPINAAVFCNDGNFCTLDYCDPGDTSGNVCNHKLYTDSYLRKYICTNFSVCQTVQCTVNRCIYTDISCSGDTLCTFFVCNASTSGVCKPYPTRIYTIDKCGVCGGNGLSCVPTNPGNPKKTSIAVALGVGLGVGLAFACAIIGILSKKSFDAYNALAVEHQGTVTNNPTHVQSDTQFNTTDYHRD
jgi:hypothetical protein